MVNLPLYDAHNHLHDQRLTRSLASIILELERLPLRRAVVNGTRPQDWPTVAQLAREHPWIIPSYGLHPWYVNQICENWQSALSTCLENRSAAVGEIGLDRRIENRDSEKQEEVFIYQLGIAKSLHRPVTIHCLKAWGRLLEILQHEKLPSGFLLHSYGGPAEMVKPFLQLGAYFSLSGYFSQDRKSRQRDVFRTVPLDRILLETDAPDMALPPDRQRYVLHDRESKPLNHPANIAAVYDFASELYGIPLEELTLQVESNFLAFFHSLCLP